jgi:hypothetical protein
VASLRDAVAMYLPLRSVRSSALSANGAIGQPSHVLQFQTTRWEGSCRSGTSQFKGHPAFQFVSDFTNWTKGLILR